VYHKAKAAYCKGLTRREQSAKARPVTTRIYSYAACSTCKKALRWLQENDVDVEVLPIVERPPSKTTLKKLWKLSELPLKKFFNTSGKSYRDGGFGERLKTMTDDEALAALAADGKLIKRPLLVHSEGVLVGFREDAYAGLLGASA
jgi:arsenate reductase